MVLPERFELSASPLPMECSTPELRQPMSRGNCHRVSGIASLDSRSNQMMPAVYLLFAAAALVDATTIM